MNGSQFEGQSRRSSGEVEKQPKSREFKLIRFFSDNTAAMIIMNSNYIYAVTNLFVDVVEKARVHGTSTFYFYQKFYNKGYYPKLPELGEEFNSEPGKEVRRLLGSLRVTMPTFVFDEFLELVSLILDQLEKHQPLSEITGTILSNLSLFPHLTFDNGPIGKLGYTVLEENRERRFQYVKKWVESMVVLIQFETKEVDNKEILEIESTKSKSNKSQVIWSDTKENQSVLLRKRTQDSDQGTEIPKTL